MNKTAIVNALAAAPAPLSLGAILVALGRVPGDVAAENTCSALLSDLEKAGQIRRLNYQTPTWTATP